MIRETVNAVLACVVTLVLCAVAYPAAVWGLGMSLFPRQAAGSLIVRDGKVVGSELIGQPFSSDKYFHPRPSAAGANGYDASAASGSNLGTKNPALRSRIALDAARNLAAHSGDAGLKAALDALDKLQADLAAKKAIKEPTKANVDAIPKLEEQVSAAQTAAVEAAVEAGKRARANVPPDLITASGSGLDPDISPEAAHYQEASVAAARKLPVERVRALIDSHVETSGAIVGAPPRVNVLALNLALDEEKPMPAAETPPPAASSTPTLTPTPATPSTEDLAEVRGRIKALSDQIDRLRARIEALPKEPTAPAGQRELVDRVSRIAEATDRLPRIGERVDAMAARLNSAIQDVRSLRSEVASASRPPSPSNRPGTPRPAAAR